MKTILRITANIVFLMSLLMSTGLTGNSGKANPLPKKEKSKMTGWIGVMVQDVSDKIVKKYKLSSEEGAYVEEVIDESPADSAGIKEGDVIVEFGGRKLFDAEDLSKAVQQNSPGTKVSILLIREGEKKTISLVIGKKKMMKQRFGMIPPMPDVHIFAGNKTLGLQLLTLNDQLGEYFGAPNNEGILVEEVEKESTGDKAGFKAGDIITRIGKKIVNETEKIQKELGKYDEGDKVEIEVLRKGIKKTLSVEMEEESRMQKNFFFHSRPHLRMFPQGRFDDTEMQMELDDLQPDLDQAQRELEETSRDLENKHHNAQKQFRHLIPPSQPSIGL